MGYPKKTVHWESYESQDSKSGGSMKEVGTEYIPDFEKFSEKDHMEYKLEKATKENDKLKIYLSWIAFGIIIILGLTKM